MDVRHFVLSYYDNAAAGFHLQKVERPVAARELHTHAYFQIYFVSRGSLRHFVDGKSARLSKGDMFIIPPGTAHRVSPEPEAVFYAFSFMPDFLGVFGGTNDLARDFLRRLGEKKRGVPPRIALSAEDAFRAESMMIHALREFETKPPGYAETIRAAASILVTVLARAELEPSADSGRLPDGERFVTHCVEYVETHCAEPISLDEIARRSALSKSDFCARFRRETGTSFHRFLNQCRIRSAQARLREGYPAAFVSDLCGYRNFSTFYRNFKQITGVSPLAFKTAAPPKKEDER